MGRNISKDEVRGRRNQWTFNQHHHGGSRIYLDGESGERHLLVDTYYTEEFSIYMEECARRFFDLD